MNRPQINPEQLLGGYATGTLTEAEKTLLYKAALEDQELFDALANEEALRELLADPRVRQKLLAVVQEPRVVPFWRRPAVLGLAASLLLIVTTTIMIRREPVSMPALNPKQLGPVTEQEKPAPEASGKPVARREPKSPGKIDDVASVPMKPAAGVDARMADEKELKRERWAEDASSPDRSTLKDADKAQNAMGAGLAALAAPPQTPAPAVAKAPAPVQNRALQEAAPSKASDHLAEEARGYIVKKKQSPESASQHAFAPPLCTLERLEGNLARLKVIRERGGYLYVLKRAGGHVSVIPPRSTTQNASGSLESRFELSLLETDLLDVYLLPEPATDPASLPAEGPVAGHRERLSHRK